MKVKGKHVIRGILALVLAFGMILSEIPTAALAQGEITKTIAFDDASVTRSSGWDVWEDADGRLTFSNTPGDTIEVTFEGTGFAILGQKAKNGPIAEVTIDGGTPEECDFYYSGATTKADQKVYEKTGLTNGTHTAKLLFTERSTAGTGSFAQLQIAISGFEIYQEPEAGTYMVTVNGGTGAGSYAPGTVVAIKADAPATGKAFAGWSAKGVTLEDASQPQNSFVMPEGEVTLTANFDSISERIDHDAEYNAEGVTYGDGWLTWTDDGYPRMRFAEAGIQKPVSEIGTIEMTFEGVGLAVYGRKQKNGPIAEITIDGVTEEFDLYGSSRQDNVLVYEKMGLTAGEHKVTIRFSEKANPQAGSGFANYQMVLYGYEIFQGEIPTYGATVINGTADAESYRAGELVTIQADAAPEGKKFDRWVSEDVEVTRATSAKTTFVMPAYGATVTALYKDIRLQSEDFYVDAENGDDTADGHTPATAWKTLSKVNAEELQAGDRVLLKAGSVFEESLLINGSGSKENPIIIDMYNGDVIGKEAGTRPHINGGGKAKVTVDGRQVSYGVYVENSSYVYISNLEISNQAAQRQLSVGLAVNASSGDTVSGIHLDNLYVHDVNGITTEKVLPNGGIYFVVTTEGAGSRFDDILIENCSVKRVSRTGISVGYTKNDYLWDGKGGRIPQEILDTTGHTNVVIRNNYVEDAGGDAIVPMYSIKPLVEYNISSGASKNTETNPGAMYNAGVWPWRCEDALFQFNEVYGTHMNGDGQGFDCDYSRATVYQYNYSHDNGGGFLLVCQSESLESVIRYNISQNDRRYLFLMSNPNNADMYNNTFYIGEGLNVDIVSLGGKATMTNNIFYNLGTKKSVNWGSGFTYDHNLFYGFDNTPNDANKIIADPMFVDPGKGGNGVEGDSAIDTLGGYALQEGSPAIDAGAEIADNGGRDYAGNALGATPTDIGAMEYVKAVVVNKTLLQMAYDRVKNLSTDGVIESAAKYFAQSLAKAQAVLENEKATQEEVNAAWNQLLDATWSLGIYKGEKGELKALIDQASAMNQDEYEADNWGMLEEALANANTVYEDEDATQDVVDEAVKALQEAIDAQVKKQPVNKEILKSLIDRANEMLPNEARYVAVNWPELTEKLAKGQEVYDNEKATQEEVDKAADDLLGAILAQRFKADKSNLEELLKKAETIDTTLYTAETVQVFRAALANAKAVMADETLSQDDQQIVDAAVKALADAKDGLKLADNGSTGSTDKDNNQTSGTDAPKTGDSTPVGLWVSIVALAMFMAALLVGKKKNNYQA